MVASWLQRQTPFALHVLNLGIWQRLSTWGMQAQCHAESVPHAFSEHPSRRSNLGFRALMRPCYAAQCARSSPRPPPRRLARIADPLHARPPPERVLRSSAFRSSSFSLFSQSRASSASETRALPPPHPTRPSTITSRTSLLSVYQRLRIFPYHPKTSPKHQAIAFSR